MVPNAGGCPLEGACLRSSVVGQMDLPVVLCQGCMATDDVPEVLGATGVTRVSVPPLSGDGWFQRVLLPPHPGLQLNFVSLASHSPVLEAAGCWVPRQDT